MSEMNTIERPLTPDQLADLWQVSARTIRSMCAAGEIEAFRVGKSWRIPRAAVRERHQCEQISGSSGIEGDGQSHGERPGKLVEEALGRQIDQLPRGS